MSETKTIEERYEKTDDLLKRLLEYREPKPNTEEVYRQTRRLLKDLMAERGKMKERIEKAQGELIELSEALDAWGHPATAGQLMGIYDILEAK